ncbi:hypothetical protein QQS21_003645 [Conoideocrella luteorostrata]|uniref:Mitotic apparatus protein p62 n=1 Tax=Conoideocrella luteorostrata TaxID=1105319 RepID=A0AAJ0CVC2_9HYPO|nr:hypothetical protein QQS21_003645 [Conoideocrella luteorostrata]
MPPMRVLKFSRTDHESSCVLVQVSSKGSKPLDLKIVATEGEAAYFSSLRHDRISSLRIENCPVSESEWQDILTSIFEQEILSDIQVSAAVQSEVSISLTVRKQVQGITQRLGAITLNYEDETIDLFGWCAASADAVTKSKESANESKTELNSLQASVEELKSQLEELILAKQEDEVALLQKFRDLLNEKKVKIREQQKIIAELSANAVDVPETFASNDEQLVPKSSGRKPSKRKAKAVDSEDSEEDAIVAVKSEPEVSDTGNRSEETASDASEDEDEDEDEEEDMGEPQSRTTREPEPSKKPAAAPPPPRNLPFQRKKPVVATNDSDSDDEL